MSDRENTRRCQAVLTTDKHGKIGTPCKQWAQHDSPYCNRHQGGDGAGTPRDVDSIRRRCHARAHVNGGAGQCRNAAMRGQTVCSFHGGATPASKAKAQEMLDRMVEPVLWELRDIALNPDSTKGERLRAIQIVLDRTLPKEVKHEVEVKPWEITMQQVFAEGAPALIRQPSPEQVAELEAYMPEDHRVDDDYADDIEEAEIVEEDPRDELWTIHPPHSSNDRATAQPPRVMVGSAEPPRRRRDEDD